MHNFKAPAASSRTASTTHFSTQLLIHLMVIFASFVQPASGMATLNVVFLSGRLPLLHARLVDLLFFVWLNAPAGNLGIDADSACEIRGAAAPADLKWQARFCIELAGGTAGENA